MLLYTLAGRDLHPVRNVLYRQIPFNVQNIRDGFTKPVPHRFSAFQTRLKRADNGLPPGNTASRADCYSDNQSLLPCAYANPAQLDAYRRNVLHPQLGELACSDAAIAAGIARRGYDEAATDAPDFGLAAALLARLETPQPCAGLDALSEQVRQKLRDAAESKL